MSAYSDWKAGDKVVCIRPNTGDSNGHPGWVVDDDGIRLLKGKVYTIRSIAVDPIDGRVVVLLAEIFRVATKDEREVGIDEPGFYAWRFRKVATRPTSIAVFERLLNPSQQDTFRELQAEMLDYDLIEVPFQ